MRIKKLHIHNIASIADSTIDFTKRPLSEASVFLISGETGAGKSTILDSICLALYDRTPRMSSVSKEDIGGMVEDERYYTNDNSQFLRRGTGEGWVRLLFEGSDLKDYEAVWAVQRNHKKADKKLQRPYRSLAAVDGSYAETNKRVIPEKIIELTGLDYDQFCRTVMLAQGEFTKFLKSGKDEKSEILEKITGTGIYSELGKKIASRFLMLKGIWESAKEKVRDVSVFSPEEIMEKETAMKGILDSNLKLSRCKEKWIELLKAMEDLSKFCLQLRDIESEVKNLEEILRSESFLDESSLVAEYNLSAEVRVLVKEKDKCIGILNKKIKLLSEIKSKFRVISESKDEKRIEIDNLVKKINDLQRSVSEMDLNAINERMHSLIRRDKHLDELEKLYVALENDRNHLRKLLDEESLKKEKHENLRFQLTDCMPVLDKITSEFELIRHELDRMELAGMEGVRKLRSTLRKGDFCPVCGNMIESLVSNDIIDSMLSELRIKKMKAEEERNRLISEKIASENLLRQSEKDLSQILLRINDQKILISEKEKVCECKASECGLDDIDVSCRIDYLRKERHRISVEVDNLRKIQIEVEDLISMIGKNQNKLEECNKKMMALNETEKAIQISATECDTDIRGTEERMRQIEATLAQFLYENPLISREKLESLCGMEEKIIRNIESKHRDIKEKYARQSGAYDSLRRQIEELEKTTSLPEMFDSEESLKKHVENLTLRLDDNNREYGRLKEQIENDAQRRKELEALMNNEQTARAEKERWEGLYRLLGDNEGSKFRNVAQSMILNSMLENANFYMMSFTDRYTLTCNPGSLAILVKDSYRPTDPQPSSILSGGESFMASLSLALALSNMRSNGNGADILFIDEGFGTLSPEYLGNVMDTLEKLYQVGGRKVGLISHVAEMKERIPVRIQVDRDSPSLSHLRIIDQ